MRGSFASFAQALVRPDRAFAGRELYQVPKSLLFLLLFLLYVVGGRLAAGYDQNAHAKELALIEADSRMSGFITNAPPEAQARAREQMVGSILGNQSGIITSISVVFSGLFFLVIVLEAWLVSTIVTQFFGGQEERHGPERPSLSLMLVAFVPVALRKVLEGAVLAFRSPDAASNALTLIDYRAVSAVRFDLFSFVAPQGVPGFVAALGRMLTDPFFLWALALVALGGREVFRLPLKSAVSQALILVVLLALQATLLQSIGLRMEI
jgi:hypothetical protein